MSSELEMIEEVERIGITPDPVATTKPATTTAAPTPASAPAPLSGFRYEIRRGRIFWQGRWTKGGAIGVTNGHTYRSFTRERIIAKMERIKARHERRAQRKAAWQKP